MAANSKSTQGIAILGKRVVNQFWTANSARSLSPCATITTTTDLSLRRSAHTSVYDKNPDDEVRPHVVPDDVIQPESDKYWAPHPQTGVFGPVTGHLSEISGDGATPTSGGQDTVLEEKAWFRPTSIEDLEKPHHHN